MSRSDVFSINQVVIAIIGLISAVVFIYEDPVHLFAQIHVFFEFAAWIVIVMVGLICVWQVCDALSGKNRTVCKGEVDINRKMLSIIREPGNTCIVSRNLSWTSGSDISKALLEKAKAGDLSVFLNEDTAFSRDLASSGASVVVYRGYIPKCRFTIKGYKGTHARLYIAVAESPERHVIYHYLKNNDIPLRLSEDIVHILENVS